MDPSVRNAIARIEVMLEGNVVNRGTACRVGENVVVSALHVVADRYAEPIHFFEGTIRLSFPLHSTHATVIDGAWDVREDWVLLRAERPIPAEVSTLPLASLAGDKDEWQTYGFPDAQPRDGMACEGTVAHRAGTLGGVPVHQLFCREAAAGDGMPIGGLSGAPVVVAGAVVGILRWALMVNPDRRNVGGTIYACPTSLIAARCPTYFPAPLALVSSATPSPHVLNPDRNDPTTASRSDRPDAVRRGPKRSQTAWLVVMFALLVGAWGGWEYWRRARELDGMVFVPAGTFMMGRNNAADEEETPANKVSVPAFHMDRTPVTNAAYEMFVRQSRGRPPSDWNGDRAPTEQREWPVAWVSWEDATAYCGWRQKRLPSEAEWEYAARGDDGRLYPWGMHYAPDAVNSLDDAMGRREPVRRHPGNVSPFGVLDMSGNVWQWCADDYRPYPGRQAGFAIPQRGKVIRGGSFNSDEHHVTATTRNLETAENRKEAIGFRCAR